MINWKIFEQRIGNYCQMKIFQYSIFNLIIKILKNKLFQRVLSLMYRQVKNGLVKKADVDMIFLGFVGIYDPPRPESKDAVQICFGAGIEVHMLTGIYFF